MDRCSISNFEPILQVLDFVNKLYSRKFQIPGHGALQVAVKLLKYNKSEYKTCPSP
jgi:hypothetical protein